MVALSVIAAFLWRSLDVRASHQSWTLSLKQEFDAGLLSNVTAYIDYLELSRSNAFVATSTPSGSYDLRDVAMLSGLDAWAVGTGGKILRWNGSAWSAVSSPTSANLYGVSMASSTSGWAVGANRIIRFSNGVWSDYGPSPTNNTLYAVDMVSANSGWAVGAGGEENIVRWNGSVWKKVRGYKGKTLYGLDMVSNVDGWAVGEQGLILRWGGSYWSKWPNDSDHDHHQSSPTSNTLYAVSMATPTRGWAVGANGTILQWDGVSWSAVSSSKNPVSGNSNVTLHAVHAVSENEAWAAGYDAGAGKAVVLRWNGSQWSNVSLGALTPPALYGIAMNGAGSAGILVGAGRTALKYGGYLSPGTATYTFDAGQPVAWDGHAYVADTVSGVTAVSFRFSFSDDGNNWSAWSNSVAGQVYRYLKQEITLTTSDWTRTPRLDVSSVRFSVPPTGVGPGWIPKAGPQDVKTWVYSNKVLVLFTAKAGAGSITYTVYRHAYEQDRTAVALGWVKTDNNGRIIASSPPGAWNGNDPWFPGRLVFTDSSVENFREYYYYVTDGAYTGDLRDYIVASAFPPTQTRHGNFTQHTNACTACHGLHSSPSRLPGRGKLWKAPTAIDLCRSCHDGSGSRYDETNGWVRLDVTWSVYTSALAGPYGGALGGLLVSANPTSIHNIGMVLVNQAPGSGAPLTPDTWTKQLSCISCHEPHNKFRNYRILRGSIHNGRHVRVRAFSEVHWSADKTSAATYQEYIAGINDFCAQCHVYFYNDQLGIVDKTPGDPTVAANVYGKHRHPIGIQPAMYTAMGQKSVVVNVYGYQYPFEDADPARQILPNQDLPLEGTRTGSDYTKNAIVCLTCHMAHGTTKTGQKQVAYLNGDANNTSGAAKMDRYGGYTDRYKALDNLLNGGSTVLMRTDNVGVCQRCHQKDYLPKQYYWDGSNDVWCEQDTSCGGGFVSGMGAP